MLQERAVCIELDLIETVVLKMLYQIVRKSHVRMVWAQVQPSLRRRLPSAGLTVIWDPERRDAVLAVSDREIVEASRHGRVVQVIPLDHAIATAREAFHKEQAVPAGVDPGGVGSRTKKRSTSM